MYAVIESGGKQYRVAVGDRVKVESLTAELGDELELDNVLMIADGDRLDVGSPYTGSKVGARVVEHGRGRKVTMMKLRRRKNSRRRAGHRQNYTELEITSIGADVGGRKKALNKSTEASSGEETGSAQQVEAKTVRDNDLTQLSGVGPVLAEKLNEARITSLTQVAAWSEEDVARFDEELDFKGRIERDDWVGQAKKLIETD